MVEVDEVVVGEDNDLNDIATNLRIADVGTGKVGNGSLNELKEDSDSSSKSEDDKPVGWVEWRETPESKLLGTNNTIAVIPNGELETDKDAPVVDEMVSQCGPSSADADTDRESEDAGGPNKVYAEKSVNDDLSGIIPGSQITNTDSRSVPPASEAAADATELEMKTSENGGNLK